MEDSSTSQQEIQQLGHITDNYASLYHSCYNKDMIPETQSKKPAVSLCNNKLVWLDLDMVWLNWSGLYSSYFAHAAASYDCTLNQVHTSSFTGLVRFGFSFVGLVGAM